MIHALTRPERSFRLLYGVVAHQVAALRAAVAVPLDTERQEPFRERFVEELTRRGWAQFDAAAPGGPVDWLLRKPTQRDLLCRFSSHPSERTALILDAIERDHDLLKSPRRERFSFFVKVGSTSREEVRSLSCEQIAASFLSTYYDDWSTNGMSPAFFSADTRDLLDGHVFDRHGFLTEFHQVNRAIVACVACDGSAYCTHDGERVVADIDHFFPRSRYPQFSCHPLNLVPICSYCNSRFKAVGDPLDAAEDALGDLPLPYGRVDESGRLQGPLGKRVYVAVTTHVTRLQESSAPGGHGGGSTPGGEPPTALRFELTPAVDEEGLERPISIMNALFALDARWSGVCDQVGDQAFRRLFQFMRLEMATIEELTNVEHIKGRMSVLMTMVERHDLGKDPFAFLLVWLLHHFLVEVEQHGERAPVIVALNEWAAHNLVSLDELKNQAEDIRRRAPRAGRSSKDSGADPRHPTDAAGTAPKHQLPPQDLS